MHTQCSCTQQTGSTKPTGQRRFTARASVDIPQRVVSINRGSRGVATNDPVPVPISVDSRMQQIDVHQVLRIGDGVQARAHLSLVCKTIGNARRGHDAVTDRTTLVVASRVQPRTGSAEVRSAVVRVAVTWIDARLVCGGV